MAGTDLLRGANAYDMLRHCALPYDIFSASSRAKLTTSAMLASYILSVACCEQRHNRARTLITKGQSFSSCCAKDLLEEQRSVSVRNDRKSRSVLEASRYVDGPPCVVTSANVSSLTPNEIRFLLCCHIGSSSHLT